jgi:hypothetical protein
MTSQVLRNYFAAAVLTISSALSHAATSPTVGERVVTPAKTVTQCLDTYRAGILSNDCDLIAACLVPPMDESVRAAGQLVLAIQHFASTLSDSGDDAEQMFLMQKALNPFSAITGYEYASISNSEDTATAQVTMTVSGQRREQPQRLARLDGSWYITQSKGPRYSEDDSKKIRHLVAITKEFSSSIAALDKRVKSKSMGVDDAKAELLTLTLRYRQDVALTTSAGK